MKEDEFEFNDPNFGELSHTKIKLIYWGMIKETIKSWIEDDKSVVSASNIEQIKNISR